MTAAKIETGIANLASSLELLRKRIVIHWPARNAAGSARPPGAQITGSAEKAPAHEELLKVKLVEPPLRSSFVNFVLPVAEKQKRL